MLYVPSKIPYKTKYLEDNTTIKIIIFDTDSPFFYPSTQLFKSSENVCKVFNSITSKNSNNSLYLYSRLFELFYLTQYKDSEIPKKYARIIPAIKEMNQKFHENKNSQYYADLCNMSTSNFRRLFKEYTSQSPVEYRNNLRIQAVNKMLDSGEFTVTEAALNAGFNNMSFFYEVYKRHKPYLNKETVYKNN